MNTERLHGIPVLDSLRGFAAISVCLFHFVYTTVNFIDNETIRSIFLQGMYGVNTFFVISGFIIPYAMFRAGYQFKDFFYFFAKRLLRLEPPYLCSLIIAILLLFVRSRVLHLNNHSDINVRQILLHFGYLIPFFDSYKWLNEVYWTLAVEFQYYILIALLFIPMIKANTFQRCFFYIALLSLSFISNYLFLPCNLPFFLLGILMFLYKTALIQKQEFISAMILTLIFICFKYEAGVLLFALIPIAALLFFHDRKVIGLHRLGKFSYSIYLTHTLVGSAIINVLSHHVHSSPQKAGIIILGLIVTFIVSWVMFYIIEKPSQKFSKAIVYGK